MMKIIAVLLSVVCLSLLETPEVSGQLNKYYYNYYYRTYYFRVVTYRRYRYSTMNRLKLYSRKYTYSSLGAAYYYHNMYSVAARVQGFVISTTYLSTRKCSNFETNPYGDFIGYFNCPLYFEPSTYIYCCGYTDYNYCCSNKTKSNLDSTNIGLVISAGTIIGIIIGGILGICGIVSLVILIYCCCCKTTRVHSTVGTTAQPRVAVMHTNQSAHTQQFIQQPPAYSGGPPAYPLQPTVALISYPNQQPIQGAYPVQPPKYNAVAQYPLVQSAYPPPADVPPPSQPPPADVPPPSQLPPVDVPPPSYSNSADVPPPSQPPPADVPPPSQPPPADVPPPSQTT